MTDFLQVLQGTKTTLGARGPSLVDMKLVRLFGAPSLLALGSLLAVATPASANEVTLSAELATPVVLAGDPRTAFLKVDLTGADLPGSARAPVNLAIVLDRSSSMAGEKIVKAKEAALLVLERLDDRDVISVVTYDSTVEVLVPATAAANRELIAAKIRALEVRGSTALFAGVSRGLAEVRKFLSRDRVNRIILLSDGQANVGPSSPNELGALGASCAKQGVSVTTIGLGLGYNEDLMAKLAQKSDGNHAFAADAAELVKIFDAELGDVLSVVAQEVSVKLRFTNDARPIRVLNREAEINGDRVFLSLNQLYRRQHKYFLLEVSLPAGAPSLSRPIAEVETSYANLITGVTDRKGTTVSVRYSSSAAEVARATRSPVMIDAIGAIANEKNRIAVTLRDEGKLQQAKQVLLDNATFLNENAARYNAPSLSTQGVKNKEDAENLDDAQWNYRRKVMRKTQHELETQQSY